MPKPYIIWVASQKGGVGKTTFSINLASAFVDFGYKTLLVDADSTNPSAGFHLGIENANIGFRDIVLGKNELKNAIVPHNPSGISVLPGTVHSKPFLPTREGMLRLANQIDKHGFDFVIYDTSPGFYSDSIKGLCNEAVIITTPDMPSSASAIRLANSFKSQRVKSSVVVNRVRNRRYELTISEIEEAYGERVHGVLPEDENVPTSIADHIPLYVMNKKEPFARGILSLGRLYASGVGYEAKVIFAVRTGVLEKIKKLFSKKG